MDNKGSNNNNNQNNNNKNGMTILIFVLAALIVLFIASIISNGISKMTNQEVSYSEFKEMVKDKKVESVEFNSGRINIVPKTEDGKVPLITYYTVQLANDESLYPMLDEYKVNYKGVPASTTTAILYNILSIAIPILILWIALGFIMRRMGGGGGVMGVGKSTAKIYVEKQTGVTFKDVAGQDEAKESLQEVVDFLHNPQKYTDIGAKLPKGALLVGPPGTGKTLLAKAVAGEAKVPFFSLAGSDFVEMFVGVGASRVRDLFKEAQKQAPCIIFIDEIDAIGKSRDTRYGGNDEREQTLNQLLAEMDGFDTSKGLLILAATNRPEVLDKALLRPGRFDRRIIVDKPDLKGRKETLKVHSKDVLMDDSVDLDSIALATSGAVGSDLANMINEAAINAVKNGRKFVNQSDLFESVEVVVAGKEKKDRIMGPKEKKIVAYHEVGHALVTALQKDAEPVQKITIVPRTMGALGYTMQVPEEEKYLMTKNELTAHLVTYMGGRAAEEIVFDSVTTGASNDIEQATKIARAMVTQYGMSEKFGLMGLVTIENQYLDGRASLNCGEETAAQIDKEVMGILQESYAMAKKLLEENRGILDEAADYLYEHETITGKEFMEIFRRLKEEADEKKSVELPEKKTPEIELKKEAAADEDKAGEQDPTGSRPKSVIILPDTENGVPEYETRKPDQTRKPAQNRKPDQTREPAQNREPRQTREPAQNREPRQTREPAQTQETGRIRETAPELHTQESNGATGMQGRETDEISQELLNTGMMQKPEVMLNQNQMQIPAAENTAAFLEDLDEEPLMVNTLEEPFIFPDGHEAAREILMDNTAAEEIKEKSVAEERGSSRADLPYEEIGKDEISQPSEEIRGKAAPDNKVESVPEEPPVKVMTALEAFAIRNSAAKKSSKEAAQETEKQSEAEEQKTAQSGEAEQEEAVEPKQEEPEKQKPLSALEMLRKLSGDGQNDKTEE